MKYTNRVSAAQKKFICELRDGKLTIAALKRLRKKYTQFGRWFRNRFFWRLVKWAMREAEKRARVETHLSAIIARSAIASAVRSGKGLSANRLATYTQAMEQDRADKRLDQLGKTRKKKVRVDPERDLVHPNFKHREAEMLAVLEGDGC